MCVERGANILPHPYPLHALVSLTLTHFMRLYPSHLPTSCTCIPHPYPLHALVSLTLTHFMRLYPSHLPTSCACIPHTYPLHALVSWVSNFTCYLSQDRPSLHLVHTYPDLILLSTPIVYPFGDTVGCLCTSLPGIYEQLCKTLSLCKVYYYTLLNTQEFCACKTKSIPMATKQQLFSYKTESMYYLLLFALLSAN